MIAKFRHSYGLWTFVCSSNCYGTDPGLHLVDPGRPGVVVVVVLVAVVVVGRQLHLHTAAIKPRYSPGDGQCWCWLVTGSLKSQSATHRLHGLGGRVVGGFVGGLVGGGAVRGGGGRGVESLGGGGGGGDGVRHHGVRQAEAEGGGQQQHLYRPIMMIMLISCVAALTELGRRAMVCAGRGVLANW